MQSVADAAHKLGVSISRIRTLCRQERIRGAQLIGGAWVLPAKFEILPGTRNRPSKLKIKRVA